MGCRWLANVGLVALLAGTACTLPTESGGPRVVGIIDLSGIQDTPLQVPDTVDSGAEFQVIVTTIGPTPCWRANGIDVSGDENTVEIVPYDRDGTRTLTGGACPTVAVLLPRQVSVTFQHPGTGIVRVRGHGFGSEAGERLEIIVEKVIVVR